MKRIACLALLAVVILSGCGPSFEDTRTNARREFELGNLDRAMGYSDQALGMRPYDAACLYYKARIYHAKGHYEEAIYYYEQSIDMDPSNPQPKQWLARAEQEGGYAKTDLRFNPDMPPTPMPHDRRRPTE